MTIKRNALEAQKVLVQGKPIYNLASGDRELTLIKIYPYKNDFMRSVPNIRYTIFEGFSKPKAFFSAKEYRADFIPDSQDHHRTLYWNPNVETDENGKAEIVFYNNLHTQKISVYAEGVSEDEFPLTN